MRIILCRFVPRLELRLAEELDVVGKDGIARREIGEAPLDPDLVTLENTRIALDRLHQRAGFGLLGGRAFAKAASDQPRSELIDAHRRRREIMLRKKIGVHRQQVGFDRLKPLNHAGEGADVLSVASNRDARRHRTISAAGHDKLGAGAVLDRLWRAARVLKFLAAAGRALRPARHVVLGDGRTQQVEARNMIAQIGAKAGGDRFGDFDRCKLDGGLPQRVTDKWGDRDGPRRAALEKSLDLPIPDHAVEHAGPAGALTRPEHRSHQRKNAGRLHKQPRRLVRHALLVQFRKLPLEIIVHQRNRQIG